MALGKFLQKRFSRRALNKEAKSDDVPPLTCDDSTLSSDQTTSTKVSLMQTLAHKGDWKDFLRVAETTGIADWNNTENASSLSDHDDCSRSSAETSQHSVKTLTTPLHIALAHRPPLEVVESIISSMKSCILIPEESQDVRGWTPLHVAAAHFADVEVIARLLQGESLVMPAIVRDEKGRTALHLAASAIFGGKRRSKQQYEWNRYRTMALLMEAHPESIHIADDEDMTPFEYGKDNSLNNMAMSRMEHLLNQQVKLSAAAPEPGAFIEVCESCRCYEADEVKSVDLFLENE